MIDEGPQDLLRKRGFSKAHDLRPMTELIEHLPAEYLLADSVFDTVWLRSALNE